VEFVPRPNVRPGSPGEAPEVNFHALHHIDVADDHNTYISQRVYKLAPGIGYGRLLASHFTLGPWRGKYSDWPAIGVYGPTFGVSPLVDGQLQILKCRPVKERGGAVPMERGGSGGFFAYGVGGHGESRSNAVAREDSCTTLARGSGSRAGPPLRQRLETRRRSIWTCRR
jgi:hypothetical protein